jgi:hypothetical protein
VETPISEITVAPPSALKDMPVSPETDSTELLMELLEAKDVSPTISSAESMESSLTFALSSWDATTSSQIRVSAPSVLPSVTWLTT